jgi:hypothetical protein
MSHSRSLTRSAWSAIALATAGLSACMVVPLDPRTGQPYPVHVHDTGPQPAAVTMVAPAPGVAPQPTVLNARLYPLNAQANKGGLLTAVVVDGHAGRGSLTLAYLGDTLQGEATRIDGGYAAFGRLHNEVLGPASRPFSGRRGIANAFGSKGVNVQCEYIITAPGIGTGVCQFSDGANYQLHFGA